MHNNYYFFRHLVPSLNSKLEEAVITECFSQNKDELILTFHQTSGDPFIFKAHLKSHFSCLSFPAKYRRAKRNSINLFPILKGQKVVRIQLINNERAFIIHFNNNRNYSSSSTATNQI